MEFRKGRISGVIVKDIIKYCDNRGLLAEVFRQDWIYDEMGKDVMPVMGYVSVTFPGVSRGPHEHIEQTDYFCFLGPSNFKIFLWDKREYSDTKGVKMVLYAGKDTPKIIIVPPGVVHAYKNVGDENGWVLNFPNRLYRGWGRKERVDEVRYEQETDSIFKLDDEDNILGDEDNI